MSKHVSKCKCHFLLQTSLTSHLEECGINICIFSGPMIVAKQDLNSICLYGISRTSRRTEPKAVFLEFLHFSEHECIWRTWINYNSPWWWMNQAYAHIVLIPASPPNSICVFHTIICMRWMVRTVQPNRKLLFPKLCSCAKTSTCRNWWLLWAT